ncbi:MAG TPA: hypothetical protein DCE60_02550 [Coprococcus sp.]|nr:hypothetical protein [Coprococcus sp.]
MAGNFFQNAFEKTKSLANQAVDSTKCAAQKTKIKGKISSENSNLDRIYTEIGRYYYNLNKEEAPEEIKHLFDSAAKGLENIAALEKEYREVEEQEHRIMNSGNQYQQTPPQGMYNPQMNGMPPQGMYNPQMNGMPPQGYNPQMNGMPPQGMAPQMNGMPPQGMAPQMNEMPPQQNPAPAPQAGPVQESVPAVAPTSQPEAVPQNEEVSR